jgi:AAA+ ATPase superfamily predicted ATPase
LKNIIGRESEKKKLSKILNSDEAEFLTIYGRRRVGKTLWTQTMVGLPQT